MIREGETLWAVQRIEREMMIGDLERKRALRDWRDGQTKAKRRLVGWGAFSVIAGYLHGRIGRTIQTAAADVTG